MNHNKSRFITSGEKGPALSGAKGFTLIELIIASLIFATVMLIVGLLFYSYIKSTGTYDRKTREMDAEVRRVMEIIGRDIRRADEVKIVGTTVDVPPKVSETDLEYGKRILLKEKDQSDYTCYGFTSNTIKKGIVATPSCFPDDLTLPLIAPWRNTGEINIQDLYFLGVGTDFTNDSKIPPAIQYCRQPFIKFSLSVLTVKNTPLSYSSIFIPRKYPQYWFNKDANNQIQLRCIPM
jgi:prepilin-type N-terminal cleavage/methylation domain-containing protein